jgi:hypothetical protein
MWDIATSANADEQVRNRTATDAGPRLHQDLATSETKRCVWRSRRAVADAGM